MFEGGDNRQCHSPSRKIKLRGKPLASLILEISDPVLIYYSHMITLSVLLSPSNQVLNTFPPAGTKEMTTSPEIESKFANTVSECAFPKHFTPPVSDFRTRSVYHFSHLSYVAICECKIVYAP